MHENENARNAKASKENILNCDASFPGLESRGTYLILVSARCCRAPSLPGIFPWTSPDITPPFVSLYGFLTSSDITPASPLSNCGAHTSFWCQLAFFCTPSLPGIFFAGYHATHRRSSQTPYLRIVWHRGELPGSPDPKRI